MKFPDLRANSAKRVVRLERGLASLAGPLTGFTLLLLIWQLASMHADVVPTPWATFRAGTQAFAMPFNDPNEASGGIGWALLITLSRMSLALGLAIMVGLPVGFLLGRLGWFSAVLMPLITLFRHVSPLAWLPLGLLVFSGKSSAAIATVFICCVWPLMLQTAEGIRRVPNDYLIVARTLAMSEWKTLRVVVLPCAVPHMVNGLRHAASSAWVVVVAAEMFVKDRGLGAWLRTALAEQNSQNVMLAIVLVGLTGLILDLPLLALKKRVTRSPK